MNSSTKGIVRKNIIIEEHPSDFIKRFRSIIDSFEPANEEERHQHFRYFALLDALSNRQNEDSNEIAVAFHRLMQLEVDQYNALGISIGRMLRNCFGYSYPQVLTMSPTKVYREMNDIDDKLQHTLGHIYKQQLSLQQKHSVNSIVTLSVVIGLKKYGEKLSENHAKEGKILIDLAHVMDKKTNLSSVEDFRVFLNSHPEPQLMFLDKALGYFFIAIVKLFDFKIEQVSSNENVHQFFYDREARKAADESVHQFIASQVTVK